MLSWITWAQAYDNLKKGYCYFSSIWSTWSYSFHFNSFSSILVLFGSLQFYLVHSVHFGPIRSTLVLFSLLWSYLFQLPLLWSCSVLFNPLRFYLVYFGSIQSTSVLFYLFSLIHSMLVLYSPISIIQSILSTLVSLGPLWFYLVHFNHSVLLSPFDLIRSILIHFNPFLIYSVYSVNFCALK